MDRQNLITELKSVVSVGTVAVQKENAWMNDFLQYAVDSIDFANQEQSEASQAVTIFVSLCRDAGLWGAKITPLSFRRKSKKEGKEESSLVTALCRLEGKIRDMFRVPRTNARQAESTTEPEPAATEVQEPADVEALRVARLQGMATMLRALVYWLEQPERASMLPRMFLIKELQTAGAKIKEQLEDAA